MRITVAAPAKVNLWLRVGDRDAAGFHSIDTLFCSLELADTVTIRAGKDPTPSLDVSHARPLTGPPVLGPVRGNLAVRAATAFMERAGIDTGPAIQLVKRIPVGAGLGGGSSDAAAVLRAMARLHPDAPAGPELMEIGAALGSDVPFFVRGAPAALGTGRGERLATVPPLPARYVVLAIPEFAVATAEAYRWLDEDRPHTPGLSHGSGGGSMETDWDIVTRQAVNDFEGPVFRRHPRLAALRDALRDCGAQIALLAGSGSTVFGVFDDRKAARAAAATLRAADRMVRALVTRTRVR